MTPIKNLMASLQLARINRDLDLIGQDLDANVQEEKAESDGFFKKIGKSVSNSGKKKRTEVLEKSKGNDNGRISQLQIAYPKIITDVENIKKEINNTYDSGYARTALAILYLFSDKNSYEFADETLPTVSSLIFDDSNRLSVIKEKIAVHYSKIATSFFGSLKMNDALLMALEAFLLALSGQVKEGCAYLTIKNAVAKVDGSDSDRKSAIGIGCFLLLGHNDLGFVIDKKADEAKDVYFSLTKEDVQASLAIKAYMIEVAKENAPKEKIIEDCKLVLSSLSELSVQSQYRLIFDKTDVENTANKLTVINNFIADLAEIFK